MVTLLDLNTSFGVLVVAWIKATGAVFVMVASEVDVVSPVGLGNGRHAGEEQSGRGEGGKGYHGVCLQKGAIREGLTVHIGVLALAFYVFL